MTEIFMIYRSEDGTCVIKGEDEVNNELEYIHKNYGKVIFGTDLDDGEVLIIKGEIVIPKPKEVVKEWSF